MGQVASNGCSNLGFFSSQPPLGPVAQIPSPSATFDSNKTRSRRADMPQTSRGDAAAATWIFRGDESRRRRGRDAAVATRTYESDRGSGTSPSFLATATT